jgi:hypothetical protein
LGYETRRPERLGPLGIASYADSKSVGRIAESTLDDTSGETGILVTGRATREIEASSVAPSPVDSLVPGDSPSPEDPPSSGDSSSPGDPRPCREPRAGTRTEYRLALGLSLAVVLAFNLVFFNRYFPVQEGWFFATAHEILAGRRPYRDFYLFLQPIYPLVIATLAKLFGYHFIVLRIWGLIERLLLTWLVFLLLAKVFRPWVTLVAVIVTMAVYASGTTDVIYSYLQFCLVLALGSALALMNASEQTTLGRRAGWAALAGLLAGLAFFTKQTTGLFVPGAALLVVCLIFATQRRTAQLAGLVGAWAAGAILPAGVLLGWLAAEGMLRPYVKDVFAGAAASKGGPFILVSFLPRVLDARSLVSFVVVGLVAAFVLFAPSWWPRLPQRLAFIGRFDVLLVLCTAVVVAVSWRLWGTDRLHLWLAYGVAVAAAFVVRRSWGRLRFLGAAGRSPRRGLVLLVAVAAAGAACLALPLADWRWFWLQNFLHHGYANKLDVVHWTFYFVIALTLVMVVLVARGAADRRTLRLLFVAAAAAAVMYAHGLSYVIEEQAVAPGLGLMVGLALETGAVWRRARTIVVCAFCVVLLLTCASQRYGWPYDWWGWQEPAIAHATVTSALPGLEGLRLSPTTRTAIDDVTGLVDANAGRPGGVFTFPSIPLFYVLSGHYPTTFALVGYWDVCPDWVARADARRLLAHPPAVIVVLDLPPSVWAFHEKAFRAGRPSGQREIVAALEQIVSGGHYDLALDRPTGTDNARLRVWVRPASGLPGG